MPRYKVSCAESFDTLPPPPSLLDAPIPQWLSAFSFSSVIRKRFSKCQTISLMCTAADQLKIGASHLANFFSDSHNFFSLYNSLPNIPTNFYIFFPLFSNPVLCVFCIRNHPVTAQPESYY